MTTLTEPTVGTQLESYKMYIDGSWVESSSNERFSSVNPYTGKEWASVPNAATADVDRAVQAARRTFDDGDWAFSPPAYRAGLLRRLGTLITERADELGRVQVLENGKLLRELGGQTKGLAGHCNFFAGLAETLSGHTVPSSVPNMFTYTVREPVGVVAAVTPWNSPLALFMWKFGPAVAAGCTMVVKPSEITPVSTLVLARLVEEAGFPPGVLNVVTGAGAVGAALTGHPGVDRIAFTGSTAVGKQIAKTAADRLARVSLELGGKSPNIIFGDADLDNAVNGVLAGVFAATGQTCLAGSRVLIAEDVYDDVARRLVERTRTIKLGDPLDPDTEMGTVSCRAQYDKVLDYIEVGKQDGADVLLGGGVPDDPALADGFFIQPTIFGNVRNDMRIAREEVFGPVVCLIPFADEDEAVAIANDTPFGLAAGLWTNDVQRVHRMAKRLRAGTVWVNTYRKTSYAMPFGGYKQSGLGRENGLEAVHEYTETKSVWIDTGNTIKDPFNPRA